MRSSPRMVAAAAACLLAATLGAAIEISDEVPPGNLYQEHNYVEPGSPGPLLDSNDNNAMRNFLLFKMLDSSRNQDVSPSVLAAPKWVPSETILVPPEASDLSIVKGSIIKRISNTRDIVPKVRGPAKPTGRKWNIKIGKTGSQICYFKLCELRAPVYLYLS